MTRRQYDDYIQSLSIEALKAHFANSKSITFTQTKEEAEVNNDDDYLDEEMELSISDSQLLSVAEPQPLYGIALKMQQTGLTHAQILRVETDKTKATLGELMLYCEGLGINLQDFVVKH